MVRISKKFPQLEIAVSGSAGAIAANQNGADRVELCTALELGGLTPSQGTVERTLNETRGGLEIHALIRPRPGDFCYSRDDLATAEREVRFLVRQGVSGIVIGALEVDGTIALDSTRRLIAAAREISSEINITFHRAIDHTTDPVAAVTTLLDLEIDRVLSSGQASSAIDGLETLRAMVNAASDRVEVMAGGGVKVGAINTLVNEAGVDAVHLSAKATSGSPVPPGVSLGSADSLNPGAYFVTDSDVVHQAAEAVRALRQQYP